MAWGLYFCVVITWIICFLAIIRGPTSIGIVTTFTEKAPFIMLLILIIKFVKLNKDVDGKGIEFMWGKEPFPNEEGVPYDPT